MSQEGGSRRKKFYAIAAPIENRIVNILIKGNEVSALIDFGDMVYSPLINEIATAITYMSYDKENIFEFTLPLIHAYHKIVHLQEREISILYYLIASKLCISLCHSAHAKKQDPGNTYASVSEKNAWKMLPVCRLN